jgi:hypothetical protein
MSHIWQVIEWIADYDKASLDMTNHSGQTAMHYAAANGQYDALDVLVSLAPASLNIACLQGRRPVGAPSALLPCRPHPPPFLPFYLAFSVCDALSIGEKQD